MAREIKRITITERHGRGRDFGKQFELHEMAADQGERWCTRLVLALANAGAKLPDGALEADGAAALELTWGNFLSTGFKALHGMRDSDARPLLEELKPCIRWIPPGGAPAQPLFPGENSQIEEIMTWYTLYVEYIQMLLGFSEAGVPSTTGTAPETSPAF